MTMSKKNESVRMLSASPTSNATMMPFYVHGSRFRYAGVKVILLAVAFILFFVALLRRPSIELANIVSINDETPLLWVYDFRLCIADAAVQYRRQNNKFMAEFRKCVAKHIPVGQEQMESYAIERYNEKKYFLPLAPDHDQSDCRWLTIGIGFETRAEKLFKQRYPGCAVFGAEPSLDQVGDFAQYGTVVNVGIGVEGKEVPLVVRENYSYVKKVLKVVPLTQFLDEHVGARLVHFLTIDIEGFEYGIVRQLAPDGVFAREGVVFCQIDAEFHNPNYPKVVREVKNLSQAEYMLDFLRSPSPYIPIYNAPFLSYPHQKVTFINIENPECEQAFRFRRYFG